MSCVRSRVHARAPARPRVRASACQHVSTCTISPAQCARAHAPMYTRSLRRVRARPRVPGARAFMRPACRMHTWLRVCSRARPLKHFASMHAAFSPRRARARARVLACIHARARVPTPAQRACPRASRRACRHGRACADSRMHARTHARTYAGSRSHARSHDRGGASVCNDAWHVSRVQARSVLAQGLGPHVMRHRAPAVF